MRFLFIALQVATTLWAATPPYFTDPIAGLVVADLIRRGNIQITPGTLADCKIDSLTTGFTSTGCTVTGAQAVITIEGVTKTLPISQLRISEMQFDPVKPVNVEYSFRGSYSEKSPDGSAFIHETLVVIWQSGKTPKNLRGQASFLGLDSSRVNFFAD